MSLGSKYMLVRIDGRVERWIGWANTLPQARAIAKQKVTPSDRFPNPPPVAIKINRTGREVERHFSPNLYMKGDPKRAG